MPARASLTIGGRVVPGEPVEGATQALEGILAKLREDDGELGAYSILQNMAPAMEVAAEEPVVRGTPVIHLHMEAYLGAPEPYDAVRIDGSLALHMKIAGGIRGDIATASLVVNSIPEVLAAPPGFTPCGTCLSRRSTEGSEDRSSGTEVSRCMLLPNCRQPYFLAPVGALVALGHAFHRGRTSVAPLRPLSSSVQQKPDTRAGDVCGALTHCSKQRLMGAVFRPILGRGASDSRGRRPLTRCHETG